jgi:hypothetical protein
VLIAVGAAARLLSLGLSWGKPLDPDASEYVLLARRYSFAHPWSASYREPLWRALDKLALAPFDYSPDALRAFTTLISIATLPVAWMLLRRLRLGDRVSLIALGLLALSLQLIHEAPRGLREDTVLLLFLFVCIPLLAGERGRRAGFTIGLAIGLISVIRWEVAPLAILVCIGFALARRGPALAPVVGAFALILLSGPWLMANQHKHGDLLYNTKVHSTYYWKHSQPPSVLRQYASPPGVDPPVHLTWSQYYLHVLGPGQSLKLAAEGYPRIAAKLVGAQALPRQAGTSTLGGDQHGGHWLLGSILVVLLALAAGTAALVRMWNRPGRTTALTALGLLALLIAPYAPIAASAEIRVLAYAVPLLAIAAAVAIDACVPALSFDLRWWRRWRFV